MFTEHSGPVQPLTQMHEKPPTEFVQVAPFWHTRGLQEKNKWLVISKHVECKLVVYSLNVWNSFHYVRTLAGKNVTIINNKSVFIYSKAWLGQKLLQPGIKLPGLLLK